MSSTMSMHRGRTASASHASATRPGSSLPHALHVKRAQRLPVLVASTYTAPSYAGASSELEALSRLSILVPDTVQNETQSAGSAAAAATTSCTVLKGIVNSERFGIRSPSEVGRPDRACSVLFHMHVSPCFISLHRAAQNAVAAALAYDKCHALKGEARLACQLDKALVNIGGAVLLMY